MGSSINMMVCVVFIHCWLTSKTANGAIGLNWGRQNAQRLVPSTVVDLILQNNIRHARIYSSQDDILRAFCGSGIHLTVSVLGLKDVTTKLGAQNWVGKNIPFFRPANIRQVYIGNFMHDERNVTNSIKVFQDHITAMKTVQLTLDTYIYDVIGVKANIPIPHNLLKNKIARPSDAEFRDEMKPLINETVRHLAAHGLPLVVQMFPILYVKSNNFDPEYAFVGSRRSRHAVRDIGGAVYHNVFEFMYDSFVWALEKSGAPPGMEVVVGHIGWPTDGYPGANVSTAERFYKGLLRLVASNKGTPKRPGRPIDTYLHSVTDEPKNLVDSSQPFARHWGIFRSNGEPKYKIDLSGQGRDIFPARARGIMRMPERWCKYKESEGQKNMSKVHEQIAKACRGADCTATFPGGSCSELSFEMNVSYAFNIYFQSRFQDERACLFEGLAHVVSRGNPTTGTCVFPVEVVRGEQTQIGSAGHHQLPAGSVELMFFFVFLSSIHWVM